MGQYKDYDPMGMALISSIFNMRHGEIKNYYGLPTTPEYFDEDEDDEGEIDWNYFSDKEEAEEQLFWGDDIL